MYLFADIIDKLFFYKVVRHSSEKLVMMEPIEEHSESNLKNILPILISVAVGLGIDWFFNVFPKPADYLLYFGTFLVVWGLILLYKNATYDKKISTLIRSFRENIKQLEHIFTIASTHYGNLDSLTKKLVDLDIHVTSIVEASKKGKLFLLPIEEAVKMESKAEEQVFIISCDPELELKDEFYNLVCQNLLRTEPIKYLYFFPKGNDPSIKRGINKMLKAFRNYGNGNQISEVLLQKQLTIYRVNFILNTIVIIDPYGRNPTGWIFPNAEIERHIVQAEENLIDTAILQVEDWMNNPKDKVYPS